MSDKLEVKVTSSENHEDDDKNNNQTVSHKIMDTPSSLCKNNSKKVEELIFNVLEDNMKKNYLPELSRAKETNSKTNDSKIISGEQKDTQPEDSNNKFKGLTAKVVKPNDDENEILNESIDKEKKDSLNMDRRDQSKDMWIFNMGMYNKYTLNKIRIK